MEIYTEGTARIIHSQTGVEYEIEYDELDWNSVGGDERAMGPSTTYEAVVEHTELGRLSWTIVEYPMGAENMTDRDVGTHHLQEDFDFGLKHVPEDQDEYEQQLYFSSDEPGIGITREELNSLSSDEQVPYLVWWFQQMFWDPAQETPYNKDDGYVYIYGGPYNADQVLQEEFLNTASNDAIVAAIVVLERDGIYDWAPSPNHPDQIRYREDALANDEEPPLPTLEDIQNRFEGGVVPTFGHDDEQNKRQTLREEIAQLRNLMELRETPHGGIGHNRPPESLELNYEQSEELIGSIASIETEINKGQPDHIAILESAGFLKKLIAWGAKKLDVAVDSFMDKLGSMAAVGFVGTVVGVDWTAVMLKTLEVAEASVAWLNSITLPF